MQGLSRDSEPLRRRPVRGDPPSGIRLDPADFVHPGVECEIAVRLARSLAPGAVPLEAGDVAAAIEAYLPAIEIVDDRYVDWRTIGTPTLIADDFFSAGWYWVRTCTHPR